MVSTGKSNTAIRSDGSDRWDQAGRPTEWADFELARGLCWQHYVF